ncbi:MAG: hypothetical protein IT380_16780 [Myxococcales bacterium]|nr:hypothetical protein [Myxococcales bacterium]
MTALALVWVVQAAAPSLSLDWRGSPDCPPRAAFLEEVRGQRGSVLETEAGSADVQAVVTLERVAAGWVARVQTHTKGGVGLRVLDADSCAHAVEAAAVVVALALADPLAPVSDVAAAGLSAPDAGSADALAPASSDAALSADGGVGARAEWVFTVGLAGGVVAGPLPSPAPGAWASAALRRGPWRLELSFATPFGATAGDSPSATVTARLTGRLAACFEFPLGRWAVGPCAGVSASWVSASGQSGLALPSTGDAVWLSAGGGGLGRVRLVSSLWLRLDADVGAALVRPRVVATVSGQEEVLWEAPALSLGARLGAEWHFE